MYWEVFCFRTIYICRSFITDMRPYCVVWAFRSVPIVLMVVSFISTHLINFEILLGGVLEFHKAFSNAFSTFFCTPSSETNSKSVLCFRPPTLHFHSTRSLTQNNVIDARRYIQDRWAAYVAFEYRTTWAHVVWTQLISTHVRTRLTWTHWSTRFYIHIT